MRYTTRRGAMRASGASGELRHGYQRAASLGAWRMEQDPRCSTPAYAVEAQVTEANAYWLTQRPLDLVLRLGKVEWTWRGVAVAIADGTVQLELSRRPDVVGP